MKIDAYGGTHTPESFAEPGSGQPRERGSGDIVRRAASDIADPAGPPPITPRTLAELIERIKADTRLTVWQRRDWGSACRRIAQVSDHPPESVPADPFVLNRALKHQVNLHPPIHPKTLANLRSNLVAAMRHFGIKAGRPRTVLTPGWQELHALLPDRRMQNGLVGLMRFCSGQGVAPGEIGDGIVDAYRGYLAGPALLGDTTKVNSHIRRSVRLWNEAVDRIQGWPERPLTLPDHRRPRRSVPLSSFPESLQDETDRHCAWLRDADPFAKHRPPHACKPRTIKLRRDQIELAASALVRDGHAIGSITSFSVLVEVPNVQAILRHYYEKDGKRWSAFARGLGQALTAIAVHWVRVDEAHCLALQEARRRMGSQPSGMTTKNKDMLRQFYDDGNRERLYSLPRQLMDLASAKPANKRAAGLAQIAVAVELLLNAPVRMANLISIDIARHLVRPGGDRAPYELIFRGDETKNTEPLEYALSAETTALIDLYLKRFRPIIARSSGAVLFPSSNGKRKAQETLSLQIKQAVRKYCVLKITPHQFRHLAAMMVLDKHPNALHLVQRLLGHKNPKTTLQFYAGLNPRGASRLMGQLVADYRQKPEMSSRRRRS